MLLLCLTDCSSSSFSHFDYPLDPFSLSSFVFHFHLQGVDPDDTQADLEEEEAELGDYEDEEDDDYAENYFDNGEDDGGMDGGGSDGGGEAAYD